MAFECDAGNEFVGIWFRETAFDGFDFPEHRRALSTYGWQIHRYEPSSEGIVTSLGRRLGLWGPVVVGPQAAPTQAESTFLKAKNGANEMGDTVAASEFFRREMAYRRVGHGHRIRTGGRLRTRTRSAWRWVANLGLGLSAGYGERPSRVVHSALAIIALFAIVYRLVVAAAVPGAPGWQAYLLFSFQSFVTFILGPPASPPSFGLRLASALEGFVQAFFVALFVFTLTRSIDRRLRLGR